ncbi:MAG: rubber dioxygenase RoxB [Stenotrophobium sp.]
MRVYVAALTPVVLMLVACGQYTLPANSTSGNSGSAPSTSLAATKSCDDLFSQRVQSSLDFCRTCHIPSGVADTPGTSAATQGNLFLLSSDKSQDLQNLKTAWQNLGGNNPISRLLLMPSGQDTVSHAGGTPWPKNSQAYLDMAALLAGFADPKACLLPSTAADAPALPLLGSSHGGHLWDDFCAGKPDSTPLPDDPRTLVVPGVDKGKAVYMNAYWQTCQINDKPANCGEQRARVARGYPLIAGAGQVGAGTFFSGSSSSSSYAISSSAYNSLWKQAWGLKARPDNFDQLAAERWGTPLSSTRNPYPLPGEDANKTNGGSGQLPMALTQLRNADGTWTGKINVTCSVCHGGQVGSASDGPGLGPVYGNNSLSDITVFFTDLSAIAPAQSALAVIAQNKVRGTGNITNFQLFGLLTLTDPNELPYYLTLQTQPSTGTEDPPIWWNLGHRPSKFYDGGQVTDSKRIELSFHFQGFPTNPDLTAGENWVLAHEQDGDAWLTSLKAPSWPYGYCSNADGTPGPNDNPACINQPLAEQGAILFHNKNLWDPSLNNPVPKPDGGNGSCAGCHGAYSPRYVNDPTFLDTPALEGIAAYIVPENVIGTDSKRLDGNSQIVSNSARHDWFAYADGEKNAAGVPLCADQNDTALRGDRALGYLAPPLYGVWASAPYFHNGSVPSVWDVLKPSDRPDLWRRLSNPPRSDQNGTVVMGFRSDLGAYDTRNLGWKYDTLTCGATGTTPYIDCNPTETGGLTLQNLLDPVYGNGGLIWNIANIPIKTNQQIEDRKVYNTYMYSQSNAGHEFTSVLTDDERRALIEYLKTL